MDFEDKTPNPTKSTETTSTNTHRRTACSPPVAVGYKDEPGTSEVAALFYNYQALSPEGKEELNAVWELTKREIDRRLEHNKGDPSETQILLAPLDGLEFAPTVRSGFFYVL